MLEELEQQQFQAEDDAAALLIYARHAEQYVISAAKQIEGLKAALNAERRLNKQQLDMYLTAQRTLADTERKVGELTAELKNAGAFAAEQTAEIERLGRVVRLAEARQAGGTPRG